MSKKATEAESSSVSNNTQFAADIAVLAIVFAPGWGPVILILNNPPVGQSHRVECLTSLRSV